MTKISCKRKGRKVYGNNLLQELKEKAEYEKQKEYAKAHKTVMLTNYDFDEIAYASSKRHKRRNRE